jgi:DNA-binding PadR family transcriptional regulator
MAASRCRTRIIQEGVQPSLHVYYKNTHLKQYHKEGRALRTETTINNTYDFGVGRLLKNLPRLREIGFGANRRVLEVEKVSHDSQIGAEVFAKMQQPAEVDGQHASALRFGDPRVQALLSVLLLLSLQPCGVRNRQLRPLLAQYLGLPEQDITPGRMTYDLRRLRLHGIIERIAGTHSYRLTAAGLKTAFFYSRVYARVLRPGLSAFHDAPSAPPPIQQTLTKLQCQLDNLYLAKLAA